MTAPALAPPYAPPAPRRRIRRRPPVPADWSCENCTTHNSGRRRRCEDCGTTRL